MGRGVAAVHAPSVPSVCTAAYDTVATGAPPAPAPPTTYTNPVPPISAKVTPAPLTAPGRTGPADQVTAGIAKEAPDVAGFANLTLLNEVLKAAGKPEVDAAGLDKK